MVPDCIVAFDVDTELYDRYNGYVINEMGNPPDLIMEVISKSTGHRDYTTKRGRYADFGVTEYWRFDPSGGENDDRLLSGDRLVNGVYQPFNLHCEANGLVWGYSPRLGLALLCDDGQLLFRNPQTDAIPLNQPQVQDALESAQDALTVAETRASDTELEIRRLRAELRRWQQEDSEPEPEQ